MNATVSSRPRLICRVVRSCRVVRARAGEGHVAGCGECQAYFRTHAELDRALQDNAAVWRAAAPAPSAGFERDLLRAARESARPVAPRRARAGNLVWAGGALGAALVALALFLPRPAGPARTPAVAATPAEAAALVDAVETFSTKLTDTVIPSAGEIVANNPLQRELGSVYVDARSALDFLALNFLPASAPMTKPASTI